MRKMEVKLIIRGRAACMGLEGCWRHGIFMRGAFTTTSFMGMEGSYTLMGTFMRGFGSMGRGIKIFKVMTKMEKRGWASMRKDNSLGENIESI